jgi:biotin carboxyl carrier protein
LLLLIAAGVGAAYLQRAGPFQAPPTPVPVETPVARKLLGRGEVRPIGEARVATISGGVVQSLGAWVGDRVAEQQELARIKGAASTEILTAPWSGTLIGLPAHVGDTVLPGALVAVVGDLRSLQVETTDVDEYVIAEVAPRQPVAVSVDALDRRELQGYVRTVSLYVQKNEDGDDHYPVAIDLIGSTADLRPGMSVRVYFRTEEPPAP